MIPGITASARRRQSGGGGLPSEIGQPFGGGFYAGDIQYPDGQWYKLIVADKSADITGTNSRWKTIGTDTPGTEHEVDGMSNTTAMIAAGIELHPAANHCVNHTGGGNSDWYMPSKDELHAIYLNLGSDTEDCPPDFRSGAPQAFSGAYYRSSTQRPDGWKDKAWSEQFLYGGYQVAENKSSTNRRVRPVRRIPFSP